MPTCKMEIRQTCLVDSRNLGRRGQSNLVGNRIGFDASRADLRQSTCRKIEHQVELARDQVLQLLRVAAIEYELKASARGLLKEGSGNMPGASLAGRSLQCPIRICLEPSNQFLQIVGRQALLRYD